jgi:ADP-ribosylglycohydrolase
VPARAVGAGALLGAAHGVDAIPNEWLRRLVDIDELRMEAEALSVLA